MPIVSFPIQRFRSLLGIEYSQDELVQALEQLGCDVEDTAELIVYNCPRCRMQNERLPQEDAPKRCDFCGFESDTHFPLAGKDAVIRLKLLPARPDLFDVGGLARTLRGFFGIQTGCPDYDVQPSDPDWTLVVDPRLTEPDSYRPFIVAAVVTMPPLDNNNLREIMKLQESLHWGIGRDRKLTSIGVYDFTTVTPPIHFKVADPEVFSFIPLGMPGQSMTMRKILELHPKGAAYAHLLEKHKLFPLLIDSAGLVLSMPPIINSDETKVSLGATKLFIDVTGIAHDPVVNTLNTLVSSLIELGGQVQAVNILDAWGNRLSTPDLTRQRIKINRDEANKWLGINLDHDTTVSTLTRMRLTVTGDGPDYLVDYPAFRTDIKHEVDIFEDLAIGYGYQNIEPILVRTMTVGQQRPEEILSNQVRTAMLGLGYTEIMSLTQASVERLFTSFQMEPDDITVLVANACTKDQSVVRSHLMLGVMESLKVNRRKMPPVKIFEVGNVLVVDTGAETGVRTDRRLSFTVMSQDAGYAEARAILDAILREFGWAAVYEPWRHPSFINGRCARVVINGVQRAILGEIHPQVLNNFSLPWPVALCELTLTTIEG